MSSKDNDEECVMHSKGDNMEMMINDKADEVMQELFQSLLSRYQNGLETSMPGCDFIFDCVHLNFKRDGSYIDSPDSLKNKNATIKLINKKDHKCIKK